MSRHNFLNLSAPSNYVAGLGRGATGFTTRSDIGPVREGPSNDQIKAAVTQRQAQLGLTREDGETEKDDVNDPRFLDPDSEVGLFAGGIYTKDDEEADKIWQWVDERMAKRRKKQREARERAEREEYERKNPRSLLSFAEKRSLADVTVEEWNNLPESKDLTGRYKRARLERQQRLYAVPDSVLAAGQAAGEHGTTVADDGTAHDNTTSPDFVKIGAAKNKQLLAGLEQASRSSSYAAAGTATSVDPRGYLTSLVNNMGAEQSIGDIELFRQMFKSAVSSNPKHASCWIAAARLEVTAGKPGAARNLIAKGCEWCPKSEDIWLENIHLNGGHSAKVIARQAITNLPNSIKLWVEGMKLENDPRSKKSVIRKALEHNSKSEALWKELVNLEEDLQDARMLLAKATDLIPGSVDLWLALAKMETPENARKILNKAVRKLPSSYELWIAAAQLEEHLSEGPKKPIMKNAVKFLAKQNAMPERGVWIAEAEKCEEQGTIGTCSDIIDATLGCGLDEDDNRKELWMEDAKASLSRGKVATTRAIYAYSLGVFVNSKTLYRAAVDLERNHGTKDDVWRVLENAVMACPSVETFWLMLAREKAVDIDEARRVLARAFKQNPDNENIWLEAVKLEANNGFADKARKLLETARQDAPTDRVWMRSAAFERQLGDHNKALDLLTDALLLFPHAPKLHMMKGQIYEALGKKEEARTVYSIGVKAASSSVPLWLLYASLEERSGNVVKARSVLDRARQAMPSSDSLWRELIRLERRVNNLGQAKSLMATALQKFPCSGLLWTERIVHLEPRTQRKTLLVEAIQKAENDATLLTTGARIFWAERKLKQAQKWFEEKALVRDTDLGDTWAWYYKFLCQHGTQEKKEELVAACVLNDPRHGEVWQAVAKDPANADKKTDEVLKLVAEKLPPLLD